MHQLLHLLSSKLAMNDQIVGHTEYKIHLRSDLRVYCPISEFSKLAMNDQIVGHTEYKIHLRSRSLLSDLRI